MTYITGATATHFESPKAAIEAAGTIYDEATGIRGEPKAGETFPSTVTIDSIDANALATNFDVCGLASSIFDT